MKRADAKLARQIDLIAALLSHRYGATYAELQGLVSAYAGRDIRTFERDKDELRALGLPIRVREEDVEEGTESRYYLKGKEMYLPYLALAARPGAANPTPKVPPAGYRDLPKLDFEPDQLSAIVRAANVAKSAGDPILSRDATSAIRKLSYDFGVALGAVAGESEGDAVRLPGSETGTAPAVTTLGEALLRRKRVTFTYRSINRDVVEERDVEPYGLALTSGHWYLVGRDAAAGALRKFRVSRMTGVAANTAKPQSTDYEIPLDFRLADHVGGNGPWELGDGPPEEMVVEIMGDTGAAISVRSLGTTVQGNAHQRRFSVRRIDSFVRWIMSYAGDVIPVSPPRLCEQYRALVAATLAKYEGTAT